MVLKHSNTAFNSGATQRVVNGHAFLQRGNELSFVERHQINCHLIRHNKLDYFENKVIRNILDSVSRNLGIDEILTLDNQRNRDRYPRTNTANYLLLSSNAKKRWTLEDLLQKLFLHENTENTERTESFHEDWIHFNLQNIIGGNRIAVQFNKRLLKSTNTVLSLSLYDSTKNNEEVEDPYLEHHSAPKISNFRGIQRHHLFSRTKRQNQKKGKKIPTQSVDYHVYDRFSENAINSSVSQESHNKLACLRLEMIGQIENDVRATTVKTQHKKWTIRPYNVPRVALGKGKHSVKGRRVGPRSYTYADLREEIEDAQAYALEERDSNVDCRFQERGVNYCAVDSIIVTGDWKIHYEKSTGCRTAEEDIRHPFRLAQFFVEKKPKRVKWKGASNIEHLIFDDYCNSEKTLSQREGYK